jgi:hypothetical protein
LEMTRDRYRSYYRIHRHPDALEGERGKIRRETSSYLEHTKGAERAFKQLITQDESVELEDALAEVAHKADRQRKSAKGHKERLKALESREAGNGVEVTEVE